MSTTNPTKSLIDSLIGGALEWKRLDSPQPYAPQPDNATAVTPTPPQPAAAYTGPNLAAVNAAATGASPHQTAIGGVVFDKRFLWVSGLALGAAVILKAAK